jgi:hypothetical protein
MGEPAGVRSTSLMLGLSGGRRETLKSNEDQGGNLARGTERDGGWKM